ncbi:Ldh family oxidoreductase [Jiangella asiatica]|uniref:Ldh family oxidoreductase n=1 Tax=Jiangella asiatica TaxID=2530372 RepID=A0A4R5D2C7_9ACTN|nr:Ldh family oxidoreductase [Jiangella asiatica]TDE07432.1 Ldh family oxidoreductase [Jiangella asiatica]
MPVIEPGELDECLREIYLAVGVPPEEARIVAAHQLEASLTGHDSHGAVRTPTYVRLIEQGRIVPGATPEVLREHPASLLVDGHWGLGFVVTERAMEQALEKARTVGVAALSVRRQGHVGRLGHYTGRAAEAGMAAMMMADSGRGPKGVVPFGGSDARLGTNPISIALPADVPGNVVVDMATSAVAGGKVRFAHGAGRQVPAGWLVDRNGEPTTDPGAYLDGGALMPLGGDQGHKGYGLSFAVESLAAVLSGIGYGADPAGFPNDGILMVLVNIAMFRSLPEFRQEMAEFAGYVKASPPAPGFDEVLYPGEIEQRRRRERLAAGIEVPEKIWQQLQAMRRRG